MIGSNWIPLLLAFLGGALAAKLVDILYQEFRHRSDRAQLAKQFVDEHLDPLLKAADELVGKLRSLADEDFKTIYDVNPEMTHIDNHDFASLLYLTAKFWAQVEIVRHEGLAVAIAKDTRGKQLQSFMDCIESRGVRIVDRISQRAVGELMLIRSNGRIETRPFIDFVRLIETNEEARRWMLPVLRVLSRTRHTGERQTILLYGAVVHTLIDTLDPDHEVTRDRPSYANKLSRKTWRELKHRVIGRYLRFIKKPTKYLGPPKKGGPRKG